MNSKLLVRVCAAGSARHPCLQLNPFMDHLAELEEYAKEEYAKVPLRGLAEYQQLLLAEARLPKSARMRLVAGSPSRYDVNVPNDLSILDRQPELTIVDGLSGAGRAAGRPNWRPFAKVAAEHSLQ